MKYILTTVCLGIIFIFSHAQQQKDAGVKYGKIKVADLQKKVYSIDTNAGAVIIADVGNSYVEGAASGSLSIIYTRYRRVHILKKSDYDVADVEIPLYRGNNGEQKLLSLKAITYNLENGKIVESKLEKSGIFTEEISKYYVNKKFTLPNVKEGSIIEYEYIIGSDQLTNYPSWTFQGKLPRLWSEYKAQIPSFFVFMPAPKGYLPYYLRTNENNRTTYYLRNRMGQSVDFPADVLDQRWVIKDVPALKDEDFVTSLDNYRSAIDLQLTELRYPLNPKKLTNNWYDLAKELMEDEDFGKALNAGNNWLSDEMKLILANASTPIEKANKIFNYIKDNIVCTKHEALYTSHPLKTVFKTKKGSVSEVNLLLTAMLRYAGISADPVILSTRDNGYASPFYPMLRQYNYVICNAVVDEKIICLDASIPNLGFGKLPLKCYNGPARIINETKPYVVDLSADSLMEIKKTFISMQNNEKGKWTGSLNKTLGYYESYSLRKKIKEKGKDEVIKEIKKGYNQEINIQQPTFDSLDDNNSEMSVNYNFNVDLENKDLVYFNPLFSEGTKTNLFKSAERFFPVEMPFTFAESIIVSMEVPKGYATDELPKSIRVKLNEAGDGVFDYAISESDGIIFLQTNIKLKRANFAPEEYGSLREFFNLIVNKHNEQIVFKKIKTN